MSIQTSENTHVNTESTPLVFKKKEKKVNEEVGTAPGYISEFTFEWMSELVNKAYKGANLTQNDTKPLLEAEKAIKNTQLMEVYLNYYKPNNVFSLLMVIILAHWKFILWIFFVSTLSNITILISPYFVQQLLSWFMEEKRMNNSTWMLPGYGWATCLLLTTFFGRTIAIHANWKNWLLYIRVIFEFSCVIYKKWLKISTSTVSKQTTGKLVNLMSVDSAYIADSISILKMTFMSLFQIIFSIVLLLYIIGYVTFVGIGVIILIFPVLFVLLLLFTSSIPISLKKKDERISLMNEILQNIKNIKFFGWESKYEKKVSSVRWKEATMYQIQGTLLGLVLSIMIATPTLITVSTLIVFYVIDNANFRAEIIFPAISYFVLLKFPLFSIPMSLSELLQVRVSANRILNFLNNAEEIEPMSIQYDYKYDINIKNATFKWPGEDSFHLSNISFKCPKHKLIFVIGNLGSGKSSLLEGIIGEMKLISGTSKISNSLAYSPQVSWIQNETLKENILFGLPYDKEKYERILEKCCLLPDLDLLPNRDESEIGEKGYNLSGGQKQRLNIARSLYKEEDVYIFDDPLSALDQYVGQSIFENCFLGLLKNKTRIIATHQIQYSKYADYIYILDEGKIIEEGIFEQLSKIQNGNLSELLKKVQVHQENKEIKKISEYSISKNEKNEKHQILEKEEKAKGVIKFSVLWEYMKSFGIFWFIFLIFYFVVTQIISELPNILISEWISKDKNGYLNLTDQQYFYVYISLGYGSVIFLLLRDALYLNFAIQASRKLHNKALNRLLKATISFFEKNPIGRILSRFSNDVISIDMKISLKSTEILTSIIQVFGTIFIVIYSSFWFAIPLIPIAFVYWWFRAIFRESDRELKRLHSIAASPMFSIFSETLNGLTTIRSSKCEELFYQKTIKRVDGWNKNFYTLKGLNMWLQFRLAILGTLLVSSISFVLVILYHFTKGKNFNIATAGLSMTYAIQITQVLSTLVQKSVKLESELNSIERIVHYGKNLPIEKENIELHPKNWPNEGKIEFKNYCMKYREELSNVLHNIDIIIKPKEKIGIVGRTGSGKSSLMISLFRLFQNTTGSIYIDSIDISKIPLQLLRSSVAIIPQDPILFTGTIHSNLDPFGNFSESEIWDVLEKVFLKEFIENQREKLKYEVQEGGNNFSVGQKQLLCLARCLLEKKKILILDEATSSMDINSDILIRKISSLFTIRKIH
eukprot:gene9457-1663_t